MAKTRHAKEGRFKRPYQPWKGDVRGDSALSRHSEMCSSGRFFFPPRASAALRRPLGSCHSLACVHLHLPSRHVVAKSSPPAYLRGSRFSKSMCALALARGYFAWLCRGEEEERRRPLAVGSREVWQAARISTCARGHAWLRVRPRGAPRAFASL
jgi:hypothetical protein